MAFSHSPVKIVNQYLIDQGVFTSPSSNGSWPCYKNHFPEVDGNAACVIDSGGYKDGRYMSTGESIFFYGVQIQIRTKDYATGWAKIAAVSNQLKSAHRSIVAFVESFVRDTYTIHAISHTSHPLFAGLEAGTKRRFLFTLDVTISVTFDFSSPVTTPVRIYKALSAHPSAEWLGFSGSRRQALSGLLPIVDLDMDTALADGAPVTEVFNAGTLGGSVVQGTASKQPPFVSSFIAPHIRGDGVDDHLAGLSLGELSAFTVMVHLGRVGVGGWGNSWAGFHGASTIQFGFYIGPGYSIRILHPDGEIRWVTGLPGNNETRSYGITWDGLNWSGYEFFSGVATPMALRSQTAWKDLTLSGGPFNFTDMSVLSWDTLGSFASPMRWFHYVMFDQALTQSQLDAEYWRIAV